MDFTASPYQQTIPSRSTFAPSDHQLSYKSSSTLRFEIPQFLAFIDPRQSYLKFNIKVIYVLRPDNYIFTLKYNLN